MRIPHFSGDAYLCRLKKTDIIMITTSRFFKEKQYMWYKVRELQSKGLNKTQIGKHLGVDRSTVRKYLQMSREDFVRRRNSHRKYTLKLAGYEEYVRGTLEEYPYISAARMHDWLRECYPDFPKVCDKTVFNFVEKVRCKYGIGKKSEARIRRDYEKLPDTPYGKYAQADFGEKWMSAENGRSTKVYFFAIVLARSRYKFTCFSRRPFDTELAIYAHERAFEYFGGKPEKILYDQDRVLISRENLGDLVLTRKFQTFVREQHFQPVFCHKADPESKGKVENVVKYVKENFLVARVFRDIDSLNREALEWLERTGNGKVHGTTRLVPREEFAVEKSFLIPYHGTPQPPQEEMREYHVRKDNTVQYRGNYYSLPCGTYRSGQTTWLQETEGNVELYNKDTGKLICRHALCTRKGRTVYDDSHRKPRNAGVKIAERILFHVSDNREVAMWMDNLKRRKERYYRDNPEVILRIIPGYDKNTLIEAIRICLDKGIYNGDSVKSLCEYVCRGKDNGTETYGLEDCLPRQGSLIQSYNEILREYDKT